jgi:type II secretory pathway pseudopilin PulG
MSIDKRIIVLLVIIAILSAGIIWGLYTHQDNNNVETNVTPDLNNTTVINATMEETEDSSNSDSGQYGYCAICGKALTYDEAHDDYTQGKVCHSCAADPYYETHEGADYANKKLQEAYPEEYSWMDEEYEEDNYTY